MTFVHVHVHSEYSALDGLSTCDELAERAAADGNPAVAQTDHGLCSGHPEFQKACGKHGIKPLFGMEGYFIDADRTERPESGDKAGQSRLRQNRHLVLLAQDDQGLRDLWALSTEAFRTGFYHNPRADLALLEQYGSRLIVTSACLGGIVSKAMLREDYETAIRLADAMKGIFPGRFYLEIQTNHLPDQITLNRMLVELGAHMNIPLVAGVDAHFTSQDKTALHKLWMSCRTSPANDDYWHYVAMHTEAEAREALRYLPASVVDEAITNTVLIADQCNARISDHYNPPVYTPGGTAEDDAQTLLELCVEAWDKRPRLGGDEQVYLARLEREWKLVAEKGLAGCYLIAYDYCRFCRENGILIGPGRGSVAGSLMSYLLSITAMDPIPARLLFERFVTDGRTALPDFDMDTPSSQRYRVQSYVIGKYGEDRVLRVGTHMRYRSRAVLNKLSGIMTTSPDASNDFRAVSQVIDEAESHTAGLGLPWPELMDQHAEELQRFIDKYKPVFNAAGHLVGRLNSYGQHPAGLVISTEAPLADRLPLRRPYPSATYLVSQWDYRELEDLGLLKLDSLTLRTLDSIQLALEMIEERWRIRLDPFNWAAEYEDPTVWDEISSGQTLGMFQMETSLGQQTCRRMKPRTLIDLAAVIALVRPGPRDSGLAESYMRRRAGKEEIDYPHPLLRDYLEPQYGAMIYQEDILEACRTLAGYTSAEADEVRKILGKKLREKVAEAGQKFTARCHMNGVSMEDATAIWEKMAKFGKYAFNRGHAYSYAVLSYWTAWLKVNYPVETFAAILSTINDKDRIPEFVTDARRLGVKVLPPDVNSANVSGFRPEGTNIRCGLDSIKKIGAATVAPIAANQPYDSYDDFVKRSRADKEALRLLASAGALDSLIPSRRGLVFALEADRTGASTTCIYKDESAEGPGGLPCTFDWASEPVPVRIGRRGNELPSKPKPLPKRCTRACRNYSPPEMIDISSIPEYSPRQLWQQENETYGIWLSEAIFERLGDMRQLVKEAALALPSLPVGTYPLIAVADELHEARTRHGSRMHWWRLATEVSYLSIAVFQPRNEDDPDFAPMIRTVPSGTLVIVELRKERYYAKNRWNTSWQLASLDFYRG